MSKSKTDEQPLITTMLRTDFLNLDYEFVRLAEVIPLDRLAEEFESLYCADNGRTVLPIPLIGGLHYYKHLKVLSDEQAVSGWVEHPYRQFYCGAGVFQHARPGIPAR
jgi:transposase, IS5 family